MTPKEKAEELVYYFHNRVCSFIDRNVAKQCALKVVDEMLIHVDMVDDNAAINYWEKVKQEINKL